MPEKFFAISEGASELEDGLRQEISVDAREQSYLVYVKSNCGGFSLSYGLYPGEARAMAAGLVNAAELLDPSFPVDAAEQESSQ